MVINFSYSMAYLRSNIYSKNKRRFNESTLAYESLNNNLKQIYNEFDQMNKNLKNVKDINTKPKRSSKSPIKLDKINKSDINAKEKRDSKEKIEEKKIDTNNDLNKNKNEYLKIDNNNNFEIKCVPNKKEENNEKQNIPNTEINSNNNQFPNLEIKNELNTENNISNDDIKYKKINNITQIKERESIKKEESNEFNNELTTLGRFFKNLN